jgi:hypothetical protein
MTSQQDISPEQEQVLRGQAVRRLKKRRDFYGHLVVYLLVNGFLIGIWVLTSPHAFFWPAFVIGAWGIGLLMNAWDVFGRQEIDEDRIRQEMERLQHHQ